MSLVSGESGPLPKRSCQEEAVLHDQERTLLHFILQAVPPLQQGRTSDRKCACVRRTLPDIQVPPARSRTCGQEADLGLVPSQTDRRTGQSRSGAGPNPSAALVAQPPTANAVDSPPAADCRPPVLPPAELLDGLPALSREPHAGSGMLLDGDLADTLAATDLEREQQPIHQEPAAAANGFADNTDSSVVAPATGSGAFPAGAGASEPARSLMDPNTVLAAAAEPARAVAPGSPDSASSGMPANLLLPQRSGQSAPPSAPPQPVSQYTQPVSTVPTVPTASAASAAAQPAQADLIPGHQLAMPPSPAAARAAAAAAARGPASGPAAAGQQPDKERRWWQLARPKEEDLGPRPLLPAPFDAARAQDDNLQLSITICEHNSSFLRLLTGRSLAWKGIQSACSTGAW